MHAPNTATERTQGMAAEWMAGSRKQQLGIAGPDIYEDGGGIHWPRLGAVTPHGWKHVAEDCIVRVRQDLPVCV